MRHRRRHRIAVDRGIPHESLLVHADHHVVDDTVWRSDLVRLGEELAVPVVVRREVAGSPQYQDVRDAVLGETEQ